MSIEQNKDKKENASVPTFQNDQVSVKVQKLPDCQVKLEIEVFPKTSMNVYKKAVKNVNKEVSLPGFRKGKAPESMIIQNFSSHVEMEWKEALVQTAFKESITLTEIYPLNEKAIKKPQIKKADMQEGAEIIIEFESSPQIPDVLPGDLKLKAQEKKEVSDEQVQESLENIRLHNAEWKDVSDRPAEEGDYIDVDIQDADHPENFICKDTRFEIADGKIGDWMKKLVIGKNIGDSVTGMSERAPDLDPQAEFKPTNCKITIKSIKNAQLPEVDEELAKKLGTKSIEELLERIKASLEKQEEDYVQNQLRDQIEKILIEKYPFELPHSLIQSELKNRLDHLKRDLEKSGMGQDEIKERMQSSLASLEEDSKKAFQMFFIARKVADDSNITVSQDELVKELMLQMYSNPASFDAALNPDEARSKVYINLLSQKVKDHLIKQATIEE